MTIIHLSPKPTWRWTFGTVAIILVLGLMWLFLEGNEKHSREISWDSTSPSLINVSPNVDPNPEHMMLPGWDLVLRPGSLASTGDGRSMAGSSEDNAMARVLGSAGALTLVVLVLLLAKKLRHSSPARTEERKHQWPRLVHDASSV